MNQTLVHYSGAELLEGPVFDGTYNLLYFVSIFDQLVYCYNPSSKELLSIKLDSPVSCIYLKGYKKVLAASKDGFFTIDFSSLESQFAFQLEIEADVRYNDGIQDSRGRIIIGTMGFPKVETHKGQVFSYHNGEYQTIIEKTTISNGLAFTKDNKTLYFIDTPTKKVAKYYYDESTGGVEFDTYVIEFKGHSSPDGMCIDDTGMLWIAEWGGGCVSKWNPYTGTRIGAIQLPCINVTSCCFDNESNLYVTTAKDETSNNNLGGGLYYIKPNKNQAH